MTQLGTVKLDFHRKLHLCIHIFLDIYIFFDVYQTCCIDCKLSRVLTSGTYLLKEYVVSEYLKTSEIVFIQALLDFCLKSVSTYISSIVRNFHDIQSISSSKDIPTPIIM